MRKTIIRDPLTDPKFYAEMSKLLDEFIKQSRAETKAYDAFLKKAEALAKQLAGARGVDGIPPTLHGNLRRPRPSSTSPRINPVIDEQGSSVGDLSIAVTRKAVKRVHLSVHPPAGRVTLVAATETRLEVVRACAISKLSRIRAQQSKLRNQARETPRQYVEWESHPLWRRRQLLSVVEQDTKPYVSLDHRRIALHVQAEERFGKACCNCPPMAQVTAPRCCPPADPKMGGQAEGKGDRLLPTAYENQMGKLQRQCWAYQT